MRQRIQIVKDTDGRKTVFIHDQIFKGKRTISWREVEAYLKLFVGDVCVVESTEDEIYIGSKLPDEYTNSNYTKALKGASIKVKANAAQGIHEMIEIAENKRFVQNFKKNIIMMQNTAGTGMTQDLRFPYIILKMKLTDIMCLMQP